MILAFMSILLMGFVLGLLGGGGSILTVPILVYLFKLNAVTATAYSLFIVGTASCVGAYKNFIKDNLDLRTGILFSMPGFLGVFLSRAYIVPNLPSVIFSVDAVVISKDDFILIVFAAMMILASASMILGRVELAHNKSLSKLALTVLGFSVGVLTGFVGAGGGFIIIPVLNTFAGLDIKKSIGTSLFIIAVNSLLGFLGDLLGFQPDWFLLFQLTFLAILGIIAGSIFNDRVPAKTLKKGFGFFILILGSWIIYKQIFGA